MMLRPQPSYLHPYEPALLKVYMLTYLLCPLLGWSTNHWQPVPGLLSLESWASWSMSCTTVTTRGSSQTCCTRTRASSTSLTLFCLFVVSFLIAGTSPHKSIGARREQVPFSMVIENGELMHQSFPKHLSMGTARLK